jgi:hypothetical protein
MPNLKRKNETHEARGGAARKQRWTPPRAGLVGFWSGTGAFAVAVVAVACLAQSNIAPGGALRTDRIDQPTPINQAPDANAQLALNEKQAGAQNFAAANAARHKQIADDSARLLKLATELKSEVDKTTKDTLSLTVVRKADEIEKLAHGVKEKMKLTAGAN